MQYFFDRKLLRLLVCNKPSRMVLECLHAHMLLRAFKKTNFCRNSNFLCLKFNWCIHFVLCWFCVSVEYKFKAVVVSRRLSGLYACPGTNYNCTIFQCLEQFLQRLYSATSFTTFTIQNIYNKEALLLAEFLFMSVCFHKPSFPQQAITSRKISELTNIHRNTLLSHMKSKQL